MSLDGIKMPVDQNQDGKADGHFRGRDENDEENDQLSGVIPVELGEGDKGQVGGGQQKFQRQKDLEHVAAGGDADNADGKQDAA